MSLSNLNSMTLEDIEREIEWRKKVVGEMVGTLYPSIIYEELSQLNERKCEIEQILRNEGKL